MGQSGSGDQDKWYRYTHPGEDLSDEGWLEGIGDEIKFALAKAVPRHPAMLDEGICYLAIFLFYTACTKKRFKMDSGLLFGIFLVSVFSVRFCLEFLKENQEIFESHWPLNLGQLLSIPFIIAGYWLIIKKFKWVPNENL